MKELEPREKYRISQVAATMAIENMPPDGQTYENLVRLATGAETAEQLISKIKKEYEDG